MKNQKPSKRKGGAAVGSTALLGSVEYCSDLKYCANYLRTVATDLERHEPGAEYDALRTNLRSVATRLGRYVRQSMSEREARASLHCALGEAITRLEGLGYSSDCNEWRDIWRATLVALYVQRQEAHERTRRKLPNAPAHRPEREQPKT